MHQPPAIVPVPPTQREMPIPVKQIRYRRPRISKDQTEKMLDIISTDFHLYASPVFNDESRKQAWMYLAEQLNALGRPENARSWYDWRSSWLRIRLTTVRRAAKYQQLQVAPENGRASRFFLSHQLRILNLLKSQGDNTARLRASGNYATQKTEAAAFPKEPMRMTQRAFFISENAALGYPTNAERNLNVQNP
ncbi:hypothetical protein DMENIID0001_027550 [Sergentomyia squamirostris]